MSELQLVILLTLGAGLAMPIGGIIANFENIRPFWLENELRHAIIAFGGGALLAAIALVLVPDGIKELDLISACACFLLGSIAFMGLDILLYRAHTPASQLAAMLSDFIPESIALGAAFAYGGTSGPLLALIIALQNLPEGFNAFREMKDGGHFGSLTVILLFTLLALFGPIAGVLGYFYLSNTPQILAGIMLFAAGGILYSVFQDIAPQAKLEKHWLPTFGAAVGFSFGLAGYIVTNSM